MVSLRTKKGRLCREWVDADCSTCGVTEFKKDGSIMSNGTSWAGVTWRFSDDKKKLEYVTSFGVTSAEITRLTSKELWFKDSNGNIDKNVAK